LKDSITILDSFKEEEIKITFEKVNSNFSEIFRTLLPYADSKLIKVEDDAGNIVGINLGVAFNGMWKQSLSELSGGQKSLLALSFILALLKYKPAPLYILDEIDAALDLSHTQNIGIMIAKYFKDSQFIVVSLKEGFFSNANVIYKVHFEDGRSHVKRMALR